MPNLLIPRVAKDKKNCLHWHRARIARRGRMLIVNLATVNDLIDTHFQTKRLLSLLYNKRPLYAVKINLQTPPMRITTKYYD